MEHQEVFERRGHHFRVTFERDDCIGPPWKEYDCYGPVTEWERRAKRPYERILIEERHGMRRFYDFQEAVRLARRDGWSTAEIERRKANGETFTRGQIAHAAAESDFQRLRAWCADDWCFVVVYVHLLCDACRQPNPTDWACLGGVESDCGAYIDEIAHELADEILHQRAKEAA